MRAAISFAVERGFRSQGGRGEEGQDGHRQSCTEEEHDATGQHVVQDRCSPPAAAGVILSVLPCNSNTPARDLVDTRRAEIQEREPPKAGAAAGLMEGLPCQPNPHARQRSLREGHAS